MQRRLLERRRKTIIDPGDTYESVAALRNLRLLLTTLQTAGPTPATTAAFGGAAAVSIVPGFDGSQLHGVGERLIVADLTPVHQARIASGGYTTGGLTGIHSDINFIELYEIVGSFLFGVVLADAPVPCVLNR